MSHAKLKEIYNLILLLVGRFQINFETKIMI